MNENFRFYENLVKDESTTPNEYWNLVVITAINTRQKDCYEKQIKEKLNSSKLPKQFQYKVINDPCDSKIGSGGSTLNVILQLHESYGNELFNMKILLVISSFLN